MDLFGNTGNELEDYEMNLNDVPQAFLIKGYLDNHVNIEFTLLNEHGVLSLLVGGEIIP